MELFEVIRSRRSCRAYSGEPATREELEQIVDAGRRAPTARNEQPWEMVVITDEAWRRELGTLIPNGKFIASPGVACIAVFSCETKFYIEDCSAAVTSMLLAAVGLGLSACWVAGDKKVYAGAVASMLGAPKGMKLAALMAVGHAAETPAPAPKRPLKDVLHWERF